jgi:MOSC domain-containing protein YiiM
MIGTIISVNVGLPQDVAWQGRTVRTGVWKTPVTGRIFARRLNLDGDGQGDLRGHGGEQRAIMVYQLDSYRYWASYLGRSDLVAGNFGENLTVEGLADNEVCIGDRFRIGGAIVEVSQPRDTCYRVGIRLNHPPIAALLVAHHRPGFYFRVLEEGDIGAGDRIEKLSDGPERMTVAEIDALLYSAEHSLEALRRAVRIPALSLDWQGSMQALLTAAEAGGKTGNAGLGLGASAPLAWRGFRPVVVVASHEESADVRSFEFAAEDGSPLPSALPGQYIMVRVRPNPDAPAVTRSYSLSGPPGTPNYRIGVKNERGAGSGFLHQRVRAGNQRPAWLVHAGGGCDPRCSYQRRCWRHADAGDVAWCGCCKRRGVPADLVAAFSPRSGAPFVCQGGGRSARCAASVTSLRCLQSACAGRRARTGFRSTRSSFARAAA